MSEDSFFYKALLSCMRVQILSIVREAVSASLYDDVSVHANKVAETLDCPDPNAKEVLESLQREWAKRDLREQTAFRVWMQTRFDGQLSEPKDLYEFRKLETYEKWIILANDSSDWEHIDSPCQCDPEINPRASLNRLQDVFCCSGCMKRWYFTKQAKPVHSHHPSRTEAEQKPKTMVSETNPHAKKESPSVNISIYADTDSSPEQIKKVLDGIDAFNAVKRSK